MNPDESQSMPDGYCWAKYLPHPDEDWVVVQVYDDGNGQRGMSQRVAMAGDEKTAPLSDFAFGPRIEPPD